jgi:hypothetical protein
MTITPFMRAFFVFACVVLAAFAITASEKFYQAKAAEPSAAAPEHQVIACYFHRTVRCPTCKKISAYIEESIQTGFASQLKDGDVKIMMVDFQDAKNKKAVEAYKITGPTLVIMDVYKGDVTSWKPAPKVWSLVGKKTDFFKYVQNEMKNYLDDKKTASR